MKVTKIKNKITLSSNVEAQGCKDDCEVKVWAGKREADGNAAGCWYTYQYTPRLSPWA